jgi:hypothetical protein
VWICLQDVPLIGSSAEVCELQPHKMDGRNRDELKNRTACQSRDFPDCSLASQFIKLRLIFHAAFAAVFSWVRKLSHPVPPLDSMRRIRLPLFFSAAFFVACCTAASDIEITPWPNSSNPLYVFNVTGKYPSTGQPYTAHVAFLDEVSLFSILPQPQGCGNGYSLIKSN